MAQKNGNKRKGFASMTPEKRREIASRGGVSAHEKGTAHQWTADEARNAGRKGGLTPKRPRVTHVDQAAHASAK